MTKRAKWFLSILLALLLVIAGLRTDIDYCRNTAASINSTKIWGITVSQVERDGYRPWLRDEIGLDLPSEFVDYLDFHPIRAVASTPLGNWLTLRRAKQIYEDYPAIQSQVRDILLRLNSRESSALDVQDRLDLDSLANQAEQVGAHQPATRSELKSE